MTVRMNSNVAFLLCILAGFFAIAGAAFNWDWFMQDPNANVFVHLLGRTGARVFYIILGISVIFIGLWGMNGLPD